MVRVRAGCTLAAAEGIKACRKTGCPSVHLCLPDNVISGSWKNSTFINVRTTKCEHSGNWERRIGQKLSRSAYHNGGIMWTDYGDRQNAGTEQWV